MMLLPLCVNNDCVSGMLAMLVITVGALQEKNPPQPPKTLTRASLPVKASQLSKLNPNVLHFYILYIMYLSFMYYYNWVGIIVVVLREPPYTLYPSAIALMTHLLPSHVHLWYCGNVWWSGPDRPYAYAYARLVATLNIWLVPYKWPRGCLSLLH